MRRAFTLIELLVVIAIIAILAAILFPVFAQAKEAAKKTATLTQFKQIGTGSQIYLADADDTFPLSFGFNTAANTWRSGSLMATPAGWTTSASRHVPPRSIEEQDFVLNSMHPYIKNIDMYAANGMSNFRYAATDPAVAGYKPKGINISFNGMLHAWSATAIAQPSKLVAFWPGMFKQNIEGLSLSQPQLICNAANNPACKFTPGAGPQGGTPAYGYAWYLVGNATNFTAWMYGKGMPMIAADTSARMHQFNAPNYPQYAQNVNTSPFSMFDPAGPPGSPYWITDCVNPGVAEASGGTYYPGFFRPDSEFNYTDLECDFGESL